MTGDRSDDARDDDPLGLLDALEPMLETMRGVIARLRREGYTEAQARELAVTIFVSAMRSGGQPA